MGSVGKNLTAEDAEVRREIDIGILSYRRFTEALICLFRILYLVSQFFRNTPASKVASTVILSSGQKNSA